MTMKSISTFVAAFIIGHLSSVTTTMSGGRVVEKTVFLGIVNQSGHATAPCWLAIVVLGVVEAWRKAIVNALAGLAALFA